MSKFLYPIFKLPNEYKQDLDVQEVPLYIKWWLYNHYKKSHSWIISEIITGNPLTLNDSVQAKFPKPPLPRGNSEQDGEPSPTNEVPITNVTGDVEVLVQNKNLFDKDTMVIRGYISSQKKYIVNETTRCIKVPCKPNTSYTISKIVTDRLRVAYITEEPTNLMEVSGMLTNHTGSSITITTGDNAMYLLGYIWEQGSYNLQDVLDSIQVEQNTTASTYTPHREQTYTFPLGTQRMYLGDYLADDGIHHVRGRYIFTGNETFGYFGTDSNGNGHATTFSMSTFIRTSTNMLCNMLKYDANLLTDTIPYCLYFIVNNRGLTIKLDNTVTSASEIQNYIKQKYDNGNPFILEYPLAEEEITPYTTEQQQAYDEIKQAISYEEQTNISGSSDESNPLFEVQYYKRKEE